MTTTNSGVSGLCSVIAGAVEKSKESGQAQYGKIQNGMFCVGTNSYRFTAAVDVDTREGEYAFALITDGLAVIVGA